MESNFTNKKGSNKCKKILNEIYQTERSYQHHLTLLKTLFIDPIRISSVLPANIVDGIFSNVEAIQSVSLHLLKLMEEEGVIHALLQFAPYLKLYSLFANNFENSNKLLEESIDKYPAFGRLLKMQESQEEMESLKLTSLLVTPIQRVPRYCLLLGTLLEKTDSKVNDDDKIKLKDAHQKLKNVADHINECVRQQQNFQKMYTIQNKFIGTNIPQIIVPGRKFLKEGLLTEISSKGQGKERIAFLFNDIFILAKKEANGLLSSCKIFNLNKCIVEDVLGNNEHGAGLFRIICHENSTLLCSKDDETAWILPIRNCVRQLHVNLASLRRQSGDHHHHVGRTLKRDRPKSKISSGLPSLKMSTKSPNKLLRRQKTQSTPTQLIYHDENKTSIDEKQHFYHHNSSYGCSLTSSKCSTSSFQCEDEIFRDVSQSKENDPRKQNWSLTEPVSIQSRRPLHAIRVNAKQISVKLGCKRKLSEDIECGKKIKKADDDIASDAREHVKPSFGSTNEKGSTCVLM